MTRLAVILALLAGPVSAQQCADRADIVAQLAAKYHESQRFIGLTESGQLVEAFAAKSGSWTILVSSANGVSCVVASGQRFEVVAAVPEGVPG